MSRAARMARPRTRLAVTQRVEWVSYDGIAIKGRASENVGATLVAAVYFCHDERLRKRTGNAPRRRDRGRSHGAKTNAQVSEGVTRCVATRQVNFQPCKHVEWL